MPRDDLIQLRRGTAAAWATANPVLAAGEEGIESSADPDVAAKFKIGNGVTAWNDLPYAGGAGGGGAQTPWASNIDAASHALTDIDHLTFDNDPDWAYDGAGIAGYAGGVVMLSGASGQSGISDALGFNNSGNGLYWNGGVDGEQTLDIYTGPDGGLHASMGGTVPFFGDPGLSLHAANGHGVYEVSAGDLVGFTEYYVADVSGADGHVEFFGEAYDGTNDSSVSSLATASYSRMMVKHIGATTQWIEALVDDSGSRFNFRDADYDLPPLSAMHSVPYESFPGLMLAQPSAVTTNAAEFLIAAGAYVDSAGPAAVIDLMSSTDPTFAGMEFDRYYTLGVGNGNAEIIEFSDGASIDAHWDVRNPTGQRSQIGFALAADTPPAITFMEGDNLTPIPSLTAIHRTSWGGDPGLVLGTPGNDASELLIGRGGYIDQAASYGLVDFDIWSTGTSFEMRFDDLVDPYSTFYGTMNTDRAAFTLEQVASSGARDLINAIAKNTDGSLFQMRRDDGLGGEQNIGMAVGADGIPRFTFRAGNLVPSPDLMALEQVPYSGLPGLLLHAPDFTGGGPGIGFGVAFGDAQGGTAPFNVFDVELGDSYGALYLDLNDGLGNTSGASLNPDTSGAQAELDFGSDSLLLRIESSGAALTVNHLGGFTVNASKLAFFGTVVPADQAVAIADASDGPSAIARLNDLLAAMRAYGLVAV